MGALPLNACSALPLNTRSPSLLKPQTALMIKLLNDFGKQFGRAVGHTSRLPMEHEVEDAHFKVLK